MRKLLIVAATGLLAGQLLPGPGAQAARATELAGVTTVVGSSSAVTNVVLPEAVEISTRTFDNPDIDISSTGELAGMVLKPSGRVGTELIALSVDPCKSGPCEQDHLEFVQINANRVKGKVRLPAGSYELYLIAEGARTEVTLELSGLEGSTVVRPAGRAASSFGELTPWAAGDNAKVVYGASATHSLSRAGFTLVALEIVANAHIAGDYATCLRSSDESAAPPTTHAETCSGAFGSWGFVSPTGDPGRALIVGLGLEGAGDYVHSVAHRSAATVESTRAIGFSLSYETGTAKSRGFSSTFSFGDS